MRRWAIGHGRGAGGLLATFLAAAIARPPSIDVNPNDTPSVQSELAAVDALFEPWSHGDTPGAAVVIIRNGRIILEKGYGLANLQTKTPVTPGTRFLLASVTKQFTAMAIMMLAERGQLTFDDPLPKFFPEFRAHAGAVTVRHLLNHTAGFPEYDDVWMKTGRVDRNWPRSVNLKRSRYEPTSGETLAMLARQKLEFTPGSQWKYSNSGYVILAQIVEKVSGQPFGTFLQANIFQPLGMHDSLLVDEARPRVLRAATSYSRGARGYRDIDYTPLNAIYGEDNIYSTVDDVFKWDQALSSEKLVKTATLRLAFTRGRLNDGESVDYGFGWRIGSFLGLETVSHTGSWLGFRTCILRFPNQRFTVVILSNLAQFEPVAIAGKIVRLYLGRELTIPVAQPLDALRMRAYVGRYEFASGAKAIVAVDRDALWLTPPGEETMKLLSQGRDQFFVEGSEELGLVFTRDTSGRISGFTVKGGGTARRLPSSK